MGRTLSRFVLWGLRLIGLGGDIEFTWLYVVPGVLAAASALVAMGYIVLRVVDELPWWLWPLMVTLAIPVSLYAVGLTFTGMTFLRSRFPHFWRRTLTPEPTLSRAVNTDGWADSFVEIKAQDDEGGWAHLFIRNLGSDAEFKVQAEDLIGISAAERTYPLSPRDDGSDWFRLAKGESATVNIASLKPDDPGGISMRDSMELAKAQLNAGAQGAEMIRFYSASPKSLVYFDRPLPWGASVDITISVLMRSGDPISTYYELALTDKGNLRFHDRQSNANTELNNLIEEAEHLIGAIPTGRSLGADLAKEDLWRTRALDYVNAHSSANSQTDFRTAAVPKDSSRFAGMLMAEPEWRRARKLAREVELLRELRDASS